MKLFVKEIREKTLTILLNLSGFKKVCDHWVYTKLLSTNPVIVDLGANKGVFEKQMKDTYGVQCFAVEPNRQLFDNLDIAEEFKFNYAITEKDGDVDFFESDNTEASSLIEGFQAIWDVRRMVTVEGVSWKTFFTKLKNVKKVKSVDLLKIDIEGGELGLINSLDKNDLNLIKQLTIEFHHHLNAGLLFSTIEAIKKIINHGYEGVAVGISPTEILFVKKSELSMNLFQRLCFGAYKKLRFQLFEFQKFY